MSETASGLPDGRADVELRMPADGAYVSILRTMTAGIAARLDFTIDDIEDLRIAVGEASAMVLPEAAEGSHMTCVFHLSPGQLVVEVGVTTGTEIEPDYDSFAWQVLTTLASSAELEQSGGSLTVRLTLVSSATGAGL